MVNSRIDFVGPSTGDNQIKIPDAQADALSFQEGTNKYLTFDTTNTYERINFNDKEVKNFRISGDNSSTNDGALRWNGQLQEYRTALGGFVNVSAGGTGDFMRNGSQAMTGNFNANNNNLNNVNTINGYTTNDIGIGANLNLNGKQLQSVGGIGLGTTAQSGYGIYSSLSGLTANYTGLFFDNIFTGSASSVVLRGLDNRITKNNASSTNGEMAGMYNIVRLQAGGASGVDPYRDMVGIYCKTDNSGTVAGEQTGLDLETLFNGGGTSTDLYGIKATTNAWESGKTCKDLYGGFIYADLDSGVTAANMYGLYLKGDNDGTVTTDAVLLFLDDLTGLDYCIKQKGTTPNIFNGNLIVGDGNANATLEVKGTATFKGNVNCEKLVIFKPSATTDIGLSGITVTDITNTIMRVRGSTVGQGRNVTNIDAGSDGQIVVLQGVDDTRYVELQEGGNIDLSNTGNCHLGNGDNIMLMYNTVVSLWIEICRSMV